MSTSVAAEFPPKADLVKEVSKPLPKIAPGIVDPASLTGDAPLIQAKAALERFNEALTNKNVVELASCFYDGQAYWRDQVALTTHARTFAQPRVIATALLELTGLRGLEGGIKTEGPANLAVISPDLMYIDCPISFRSISPALECGGKVMLLPIKTGSIVSWKIWSLSTWVEQLVHHPENEKLLSAPARNLDGLERIETDVVIIGGGSSGIISAARLKAVGVESVILDRFPRIGDSWGHRYECLSLHLPTANCELPYMSFPKEQQFPHHVTKDELADHLRNYVAKIPLNFITSARVQSSVFNTKEKKWTVRFTTTDGSGTKTIVSKHFIQAIGLSGGKPFIPPMTNEAQFRGVSIHSTRFRAAEDLVKRGAKSAVVIGSANSAFDIAEDCYKANLKTAMVARSPTFVIPHDYVCHPNSIGLYNILPVEAADRFINVNPIGIDTQFIHGLLSHLSSQQPDRYAALEKAGFPRIDNQDPNANLAINLFERAGGHYLDVGTTELLASGKVAVHGRVEPVGYTETGLILSNGTTIETDAVIWATGFHDQAVRTTVYEMLGTEKVDLQEGEIGAADIAARIDGIWGVDAEGELRGVFKRQSRMDNYWIMNGALQHQRWGSRAIVQQIRLDLDGELPPAYLDTPGSAAP
ncbi:hypothetical protein FB567DRAFT_624218 [Paraphoma chrysanthemicola]|uniref:FAD/NAD(P)-binding domain-containing protein n=1 Tax=Paraphoma chrysanthemicola TaxID=798071 RepID=A0A8K0RJN2_9PLEO|nr:hypothetical protein FB567DRAFT_624218 [Paraphoma chrysanthemicola]